MALYRFTAVAQRYPWLLDDAARLAATVATAKATYLLTRRQKLVGYLQHQTNRNPVIFILGANQHNQTSAAFPRLVFPVSVWKAEDNAAVTDALYIEARAGGYFSDFARRRRVRRRASLISDSIQCSGGAGPQERLIDRPQVNGSISNLKPAGAAVIHSESAAST